MVERAEDGSCRSSNWNCAAITHSPAEEGREGGRGGGGGVQSSHGLGNASSVKQKAVVCTIAPTWVARVDGESLAQHPPQ